ncbi:hypothetical protein BDN72DRAFT_960296 [Pluteus cervinus]|uniref:Uncharacterized protein n=1 Tax=Pluteus cervinus TaxID=181527 RepID=A0ACD3AS55_9AGAR|nr:hypothetical protein BDN72DRAFT_960296 [Pluteus cervinus]
MWPPGIACTNVRVAVFALGASPPSLSRELAKHLLKLHIQAEIVTSSSSLFRFDVVLFLFDLVQWRPALRQELPTLITNFRKSGFLPLACVVGSSLDKLPGLPSDLAVVEYGFSDVERTFPYVTVSLKTGKGIDHLCGCIFVSDSATANLIHPYPKWMKILPIPSPHNVKIQLRELALDVLAYVFSLSTPIGVNKDTPDPRDLSESDINSLVNSQTTPGWATFFGSGNITQLRIPDVGLFAKRTTAREAEYSHFVRRNTTVPVPQPRYPHIRRWLVTDFIEGRLLEDCWESLDDFMRFRIASTLRLYVRQFRRLQSDSTGCPISGVAHGAPLFEDPKFGPFTYKCGVISRKPWSATVKFDLAMISSFPPLISPEWSLVFTHRNLNLTSILLARDKTLWIVGWDSAGFLPVWMESVGMSGRLDRVEPESWLQLQWYIAGSQPTSKNVGDFFVHHVVSKFRWFS